MTTNAHGGGGGGAPAALSRSEGPDQLWFYIILLFSFLGLVNVRNRCKGWNALAMEHTHTHTDAEGV